MRYAGQARFTLLDNRYYLFATEEIGTIVRQFVQKVAEVNITDVYRYHLDEIDLELERN